MRIEKNYIFTVLPEYSGLRADLYLKEMVPELSRSALSGSLCEIYINSELSKKSSKVKTNDLVELVYVDEVFEKIEKQNIDLDILYEDKDMLVINKAQGMVVHPGAGNFNNTVVNALAYRYGDKFIDSMSSEADLTRPGIVHRLDKDTSGVMVIALTPSAHANLAGQFQNKLTEKYYTAVCSGFFVKKKESLEYYLIRDPKNRKLFCVSREEKGKYSHTSYEVLKQYEKAALLKVRIYTGRTHQIRVHMKKTGHPVVGDVLYNNNLRDFPSYTLMLHSTSLELNHPVSGKRMHFECPLPQRFTDFEKQYGEPVL